jgi:hypothetical protein
VLDRPPRYWLPLASPHGSDCFSCTRTLPVPGLSELVGEHAVATPAALAWSGFKDPLLVPVEVLPGGISCVDWQQQAITKWWAPVVLPRERLVFDRLGQGGATWIRRPPLTVMRPVSKATSWPGQAARPLRGSWRSLRMLSFHGLMWPARSMRLAPNVAGFRPQKTQWFPQLASRLCAKTC